MRKYCLDFRIYEEQMRKSAEYFRMSGPDFR